MRIICFGKSKSSEYGSVIAEYLKRLSKDVKIVELGHQNGNKNEVMSLEGKSLQPYLNEKSYKIFLDSRGKTLSSEELSQNIIKIREINQDIVFFIGGAFGFTDQMLNYADLTLSLGKMTLPHMLARVILLEQIYRIKMIEIGHPYHK